MPEGIDEVDWAGLDQAYQGSVYVPDVLRQVASPDAEDAIYERYGTIFHQGTIDLAPAHPGLAVLAPDLRRRFDWGLSVGVYRCRRAGRWSTSGSPPRAWPARWSGASPRGAAPRR